MMSLPEPAATRVTCRRSQRGFSLLELIAAIVILAILSAFFLPRYMSVTEDAGRQAARGALAEGVNLFTLAHARYSMGHAGAAPAGIADLAPDYMNATTSLGDYTVVMAQAGAGGEVTFEVFNSAAVSGTPLATATVPWP